MPVSLKALEEVALSQGEYEQIVMLLGREPNEVELGMFGSLWSEHCGYKHSKILLRLLPSKGKRVRVQLGEENAGGVDIGDGVTLVMKMESHNHPSAIEPYQGAATGVGGIVRDIFTMGARPMALMNSLRFGPLSEPRNRYLFNGVVSGIAGYGNCLGIPNVGGETLFAPSYSSNPLVNALCLGINRGGVLVRAKAEGPGNALVLVGADTGRDGLHGASGLASRTFEEAQELRSAVQVGNPFMEKLLMEACLELAQTDWIVGMQDLGAAGLSSSAVECAAKGGSGVEIDVLAVPRREAGMSPYEVMLSESQERMLVIAKQGCEDRVKGLFQRWGLSSTVIGRVTADGMTRIKEGSRMVAEVPVRFLSQPPLYQPRVRKPSYLARLQRLSLEDVPELPAEGAGPALLRLLSSPNIAEKRWIYRQYDHQVQTNTVVLPGSDAALLRIKGTVKGIALATDGNGRYCYLDPYVGGQIAVAEAARNVSCCGAEPVAITDCLNFGNPERKEVYYQLKQCVRGIARACRFLGIPVISGNVSLYNESNGEAIYPTPVIGMVGLLEDISGRCDPAFKREGDLVFLLGAWPQGQNAWENGLGGSEYLALAWGKTQGRPYLDLDLERRLQRCCREAIRLKLVISAHDCSDGGLAVAIAECCIAGGRGFEGIAWEYAGRLDVLLFGEAQSRIVVSVRPEDASRLGGIASQHGVPLRRLGRVGGERFTICGAVHLSLPEVVKGWQSGLEKALSAIPSQM